MRGRPNTRTIRLRLLALVLALVLAWYAMNPVPGSTRRVRHDEGQPDEKHREAKSPPRWFTALHSQVLPHTMYEKKDLTYHLGRIEEHLRHPNYQAELQTQTGAISTALDTALAIIESVPASLVAAPLRSEPAQTRTDTLTAFLSELKSIEASSYEEGFSKMVQRFERWKERCARFIADNISLEEAAKFSKHQMPGSAPMIGRQRHHAINRTFNECRAFIEVLIEEVKMFGGPENISSHTLAMSNTHLPPPTTTPPDARNIFVVHGRNLEARNSLFRFLRSIGLSPIEWSQAIKATGKASPFIGEILDVAFSNAQAVVVLMTPDDVARLQEQFRSPHDPPYEAQLTGQARPNVLFEAGMAMGRNPDRTVIVELGALRPFSDIAGRHTVRMNNAPAARQELAQRLETAGCIVDLSGRDWHTEGDFELGYTQNP